VFLDDEAFGEGWGTWRNMAAQSENALARAMPGEKPLDLAWRMAVEMMQSWTACLLTVAPKTTTAWYNSAFPDQVFASAGIVQQPTMYGAVHYLDSYPGGVRSIKLQQGTMANGKPHHLLPWLTACTYGQMDAVQAWESTLHSYGGGATGFSYFGVFPAGCIDDPAKMLALSTATALATPFEDHFLDGTPLLPSDFNVTAGSVRAWSGMRLGLSHWLVLTPGAQAAHTAPSVVSLALKVAQPDQQVTWTACDLTTGEAHAVTQTTATGIAISKLELTRTTVLHVASGATTKCAKLPSDVWLPEPGYNFPLAP
jgi:hypothetical protein